MRRRAAWAGVIIAIAVVAYWLFSGPRQPTEPTPTPHPSATVSEVPTAPGAASSTATESAAPSATPAAGSLSFQAPLGWAKANRRDFGCMLERDLGYKDPMWTCESTEQPLSDPCQETEGYYRGPQLNSDLSHKLSPLVEQVELHWEHRQLSQIDLVLKPGLEERAILDAFQLPASLHVPMDNVQSVELTDCVVGRKCLIIHGFPRGDIDCHDGRRPD